MQLTENLAFYLQHSSQPIAALLTTKQLAPFITDKQLVPSFPAQSARDKRGDRGAARG